MNNSHTKPRLEEWEGEGEGEGEEEEEEEEEECDFSCLHTIYQNQGRLGEWEWEGRGRGRERGRGSRRRRRRSVISIVCTQSHLCALLFHF